jgi:predicted PurR-regulated permease PerM
MQMTQENTVQKKGNSKILVFALIAICVILAGSLVGVIAIYQPLDSQITTKDNRINDLNARISQLESSQVNNSTSVSGTTQAYTDQISQLNSELSDLNASYVAANSIAQLQQSGLLYSSSTSGTSIVQNANSTTSLWNDQLDYAGYVVVQATANANTTYAEAIYSFSGVNFDLNQTLGTSGTAIFPILPGPVQINIGNINQSDTNTITVTATYYY